MTSHTDLFAAFLLLGVAALPLPTGWSGATDDLARPWRLVDGHYWQIEAEAETIEPAAETDAREGTCGGCPEGMVDVEGNMKVDGPDSIEELQKTTCTQWLDERYPERCASFDGAAWRRLSEHLQTRAMRFCIDRFEYPNRRGAYPIIDVSWRESAALCGDEGKRLCTEAEWTFACEGQEAMPYSTGYVRDAAACVIDRPWREVNERALLPREGRAAVVEIDRLWQGEASGTSPGCKSAFGVYDLIGNVDEWTSSVRSGERPSILKGGYWGPVRTRCRPSTRSHEEDYSYYQQGFRCCGDLD
jgi:formylglycine-generating enzyme